jgi:hypothetical protein
MVDSPTSVVLVSSNRNRVDSKGRGRCSCSNLICMSAWIGASAGIMSLLSIVVAPTISLQRVQGNLGPLNTIILSGRGLKIVGALNNLTLRGRESLSSGLWPWLRLWLSRTKHRSSCGCRNTWSRATGRLMLTHQFMLVLHHTSIIL